MEKRINKKMNELYVTKQITLIVYHRKKLKEIRYMITGIHSNEMQMVASLKSMKYPCDIPNLENIEIRMDNEFPNKKLEDKIMKKYLSNKTKKDGS